ncbi:MAG: PepSY domain-containing protein [Tissierellia bacterium]|nr:PepSY domain-containing protein [Tissierellia bacterium]
MKKIKLLALLILSVFTFASCSTTTEKDVEVQIDEDQTENQKVQDDDSKDDEKNTTIEVGKDEQTGEEYLSIQEVLDIYEHEFPNTKIKKISFDEDDSIWRYKIEGFSDTEEYEIKIDANNGEILKKEKENESENKVAIEDQQIQNIQFLVDKAIEEAGDGYFLDEWEVEEDDGIIELEITVDNEQGDDIDYVYNLETKELIEKD